MKKLSRIIGMMCLAVLAVGFTSCNKDKVEKDSSFTFEMSEAEGFVADDSKAYVDISAGSVIKWWPGDKIMVYSVDATNTTPVTACYTMDSGEGTNRATFSGEELTKGSIGYFAFYPYEKAVSVSEGNFGTFNVSAMQTYNSELDFAGTSMAGKAFMDPQGVVGACPSDIINGHTVCSFKQIFGYANVRLKDASGATAGKKVTMVKIIDNNGSLTGNMTINIAELTTPRLEALKSLGNRYCSGSVNIDNYALELNGLLQEMGYSTESDGNSVVLDCTAANVSLNNANKYFIIPVRPGALLKDFVVTVFFDDDTTEDFHFNDQKYIIRPGMFSNIQCTF
jgi:hypothetical protein